MPRVVRVGDAVSCGDSLGEGSPDVFANDIPVGRILEDNTAGHCFAPVRSDRPGYTVYVNDQPVIIDDGLSFIPAGGDAHCCPGAGCHDGVYVEGSPDVYAEYPKGSLANVEIPDIVAENIAPGLKAIYTDSCINFTFNKLVEDWDDTDSDESDSQVDDVDTYNNVVPERPITDPSQIPPGLTPQQARVYAPPVQLPGASTSVNTTVSEASIRRDDRSLAAGQSDEDAGGKSLDQKKERLDNTPEPVQMVTNTTVVTPSFTDIDNWSGAWQRDFLISPNFTLGQVSMGDKGQPRAGRHPIKNNAGFTRNEIVKNLRWLAYNILEPMLAQFPTILVNSGFRARSGRSQHNKGQAADLFVPDIQQDADALYNGALWIRDNLNYDQFIFETRGRDVWYHLSFKPGGANRPKSNPTAVMTTTTGGPPYTKRLFKIRR